MPGILSDPLSNIQNIRELLKAYDPGFAFLKELLQNADDAGAKTLRLAWLPGSPQQKHPLLGAPALLVVNDGRFTEGDRDGLMRMGLGNKGGDTGKIGKFGLGTKSIFHVAEAFFFLESTGNPELRNILNPWSPHRHQDWETVEASDWDYMALKCGELAEAIDPWFAVWIPLRRRQDLGSVAAISGTNEAPIVPGDQTSCPKELLAPLINRGPMFGELLALLRHLQAVEFRAPGSQPQVFSIDREDADSFQIRQPDATIAGRIHSGVESGREEAWRQRADWPQVIDTREDGAEESSPDKAEWSHAVVLTSAPKKRTPKLRIYWSVFLPVGNHPLEIPLGEGSRDLSLFLHGFFFLNSSRTQLDGLDQAFDSTGRSGPAAVCRQWNRALACDEGGLLPNLLPALAKWFEDGHLLPDEMPALTRALHSSTLWEQFEKALTKNGSLAYCLQNGSWNWRWISSDQSPALVPKVRTPEEFKTFQGITSGTSSGQKPVLAVDLPSHRALLGEVASFDDECLDYLRELVGKRALKDDEARLIRAILDDACEGGEIPESWRDVPLYPVRPQGARKPIRKSVEELQVLAKEGNLFSDDSNGWAKALGAAAGLADLPMIATATVPLEIDAPNLTAERAANWLLAQEQLDEDSTKRIPIFQHLATRERFTDLELQALRYLAHANPESREDADTELYFRKSTKDEWTKIFEATLAAESDQWKLIDSKFENPVTTGLRGRLHITPCSEESWPTLVRSLGDEAGKVDFSEVPQDLLDWILTRTPEEGLDCLKPLKIHSLAGTEKVSADDESVWLDGGLEVPDELKPAWRQLREAARIVSAHDDEVTRLRQRRVFEPRVLDASGALELAANSNRPTQFQPLILHLLSSSGTPRAHAIDTLKASTWLSLENGAPIAPSQILHLDGVDRELKGALSKLKTCPYHASVDLTPEIRESAAWRTVTTQILPSESAVFETLHALFDPVPQSLALGFEIGGESEFKDWLEVVSTCPDSSVFPIRPLLAGLAAHSKLGERALPLAQALGSSFEGTAAAERYGNCLRALQDIHQHAARDQQSRVIKLVAHYLAGAKEGGTWDSLKALPDLQLPNRVGQWRSAEELAPPCAGIQDRVLLHKKLAEALGLGNLHLAKPDLEDADDRGQNTVPPGDSARDLKKLLTPFLDRLESKAVAILPSLLGKDDETQDLARDLLDGIQPTSIQDELIPDDIDVDDQLGGPLRERANEWNFRVKMIQGSSVELLSLAGSPFQAPLLDSANTIFLPHPNGQMLQWAGEGLQILCVAEPSRFEGLSDSELREILINSLRDLLWWAYVYRPPNLEEVIEKYEGLGQMSLGVARQEILRSADTQLQILGVLPPPLEEARRLSDEARARLAEADAGVGNADRLRRAGTKAEEGARQLFLEKFEHDLAVHDCLLSGIRRRISQQQYEIDSIPFEIFQNADDAAVELLMHVDLAEEALRCVERFVIEIEHDGLLFHYGGRPINSSCGLAGPKADRFRRDLVKMLMLNGSDKNATELEFVTGRFGLGFKSVFLLSDRPHVSSGSLAFDIAGAIWPRPLDDDSLAQLTRAGEACLPSWKQRTTVFLPAEEAKMHEACGRFLELAPWLPIFSKRISCVEVRPSGASSTHRWDPDEVGGHSRLGTIRADGTTVVQLEFENAAVQWLFTVADGAISELPETVPWLWVTAPTREESMGFALNGPFALDPGRTRLSKQHEDVSRTNRDLFQEAASLLHEEFGHLSGSPEALQKLQVVDAYRFWSGLWDLMTALPMSRSTPEGVEHLAHALWPHNRASGYARLIESHPVLPSGLEGELRQLVRADSLTHSVQGWLATAQGSEVLTAALSCDYPPFDASSCCSDPVAAELRRRLDYELQGYGLPELLGSGKSKLPKLEAELAGLVGEGLWPELGNAFEADFEDVLKPDETSKLKELAQSILFLANDGSWHPPERLLLADFHLPGVAQSDEQRRTRFAPADRILSSTYSVSAVRLFIAFRPRFKAEAEEMAEWLQQPESEQLTHAFRYLASGDLRQQLAYELGPTWFKNTRESAEYHALEPKVQIAVASVFDMARIENERRRSLGEPFREEDDAESNFEPHEVSLDIEDVEELWDGNEDAALREFTTAGPLGRLILPGNEDHAALGTTLRETSTLRGQAAWYRLLCLGCSFGIPLGTQPRSWVQRFWEEELGESFWQKTTPSSIDEAGAPDFNRNLDSYFEERIHCLFTDANASGEDARFWRRVFYDFRKMHYLVFGDCLPETILDLVSRPEADGLGLINFLRSGKVPDSLQDGHSRFRGVIGQSMTAPLLFVMRELRLLGILPDDRFDSVCFYMNTPARRVARDLGWIDHAYTGDYDFSAIVQVSEQIHSKMTEEAPDLVGFLDLPLQWFAHENPR